MFMITVTAEEIRLDGVQWGFFFFPPNLLKSLKVLYGGPHPSGSDGGTIWRPCAGVHSTEGLSKRN